MRHALAHMQTKLIMIKSCFKQRNKDSTGWGFHWESGKNPPVKFQNLEKLMKM